HFTLECDVSRRIWNILYSNLNVSENIHPPSSLEEILQVNNVMNRRIKSTVKWLNIFGVYEIWMYYTQAKWGSSSIPEPAISFITKNRLKKALCALRIT
ncbi:14421_t:CDS:1, partial [Racocetra persica]